MRQLVALVKAKLDPANGDFAALRGICLGNLTLELLDGYGVITEPNRLNPWIGDLRRVCEEADVELHDEEATTIEGLSQNASWCSSSRRWWKQTLDSAPVIPERKE